ncbi:MAG: LytR C-terminal domain-containing protein [Gammaproteobacteria bacterium]|nr:LytR C-terminal domain-containing protein [Gammaproteobacteria bacterium]
MVDQRYNYLYETDLPTYDARVDGIEKKMASLRKEHKKIIGMVYQQRAQMKQAGKGKLGLAVEIINRSSNPKLHESIAKDLKKKGYHIVRTTVAKKRLKTSHVYYQKGFDKQAVKLGHALPKNQTVLKKADLAFDVDLRLVLGEDLK